MFEGLAATDYEEQSNEDQEWGVAQNWDWNNKGSRRVRKNYQKFRGEPVEKVDIAQEGRRRA